MSDWEVEDFIKKDTRKILGENYALNWDGHTWVKKEPKIIEPPKSIPKTGIIGFISTLAKWILPKEMLKK